MASHRHALQTPNVGGGTPVVVRFHRHPRSPLLARGNPVSLALVLRTHACRQPAELCESHPRSAQSAPVPTLRSVNVSRRERHDSLLLHIGTAATAHVWGRQCGFALACDAVPCHWITAYKLSTAWLTKLWDVHCQPRIVGKFRTLPCHCQILACSAETSSTTDC